MGITVPDRALPPFGRPCPRVHHNDQRQCAMGELVVVTGPPGLASRQALWLRLSFSVLGQGHLTSGDHNQTGYCQRSTGDERTQPEKAERDRRLHR